MNEADTVEKMYLHNEFRPIFWGLDEEETCKKRRPVLENILRSPSETRILCNISHLRQKKNKEAKQSKTGR